MAFPYYYSCIISVGLAMYIK